MEQLATNPISTLNGAINNSVTSLTVTSGASFPATGTFRIRINDEIMKVTSVAGTTFTVVRAQEGTTAASHANTDEVVGILTKESMVAFRGDLIQTGADASRPSAGTAGLIYLPTDGVAAYYDNGTVWKNFGPIQALTPPVDSGYSWYNQGSASVVSSNGGTFLSSPTNGGSHNFRIRGKALANTSNYSVTFGFIPMLRPGINGWCGVMLRDSVGGGHHSIGIGADGNAFSELWNNVSSFSSTVFSSSTCGMTCGSLVWMRFVDDGTNRLSQISRDGYNWVTIDSRTRTNFMTPNTFGYWVNPNSTTIGIHMLHLVEA